MLCVVWLLFIIAIEKAMEFDRESRAAKMDYQRFCAEGNFQAAHKVLNYYYSDYKDELGRWRSGEWRDRQALQAQESYHSVLAYIYGHEIASIFAGGDEGLQTTMLSLLIAIPTEGAKFPYLSLGLFRSIARLYVKRGEPIAQLAHIDEDKTLAYWRNSYKEEEYIKNGSISISGNKKIKPRKGI